MEEEGKFLWVVLGRIFNSVGTCGVFETEEDAKEFIGTREFLLRYSVHKTPFYTRFTGGCKR